MIKNIEKLEKFFEDNKRWNIYFISCPKQYWWAVHSLWWYTDTKFINVPFFDFKHYIWYDFENILSFEKIQNWYRIKTEMYDINYILNLSD